MKLARKSSRKDEDLSLAERHLKADQVLADRFEQLDAKIALAEEYFRSLHLPQSVECGYNDSETGSAIGLPNSWDCLSFRRYKGKWRLCHARCYSWQCEEGTEPTFKPLVECATDVRIEAIGYLGKLKIEAAKSKEKYVAKLDEALGTIDDVISD